jgi:putative phosphoserine phosphatase/1-acylglycerol-3-phosphate O-acyltransferase
MTVAAIFDLDRTLLRGSSAPVFQRHMGAAGVGTSRSMPGVDAYYRVYELAGENPVMMQLARLAVRAASGRPVEAVEKAAQSAADELETLVLPFARQAIERHRAKGHRIVIASTTPEVLIRPLAARLGVDDVVATRWAVDGDTFTGSLDGELLWNRSKAAAVKAWARANGITMKSSYAYSDSVYDVPLLRSVGHPVAVNPDPQLAVVASLNRWPIRHFDVPPGVVKVAGRELQDWLRPFNRPEMAPYARFDIQGTERLPKTGPVIVVFNHRSYFDSAAVNFTLAKVGRPARFLGKKEVFDVPLVGQVTRAFGGIRVERSSGSDEPLEKAIAALEAGEMVCLAPQGTIPRGPAFFDPVLRGRWGAAKLAHATKAPVVPIGLWGTEKVWPRSSRLPRIATATPPLVTVRVGEPVELGYRSADRDTERIMAALADLLPPESREPHEPTEAELVLTYPPGYKGDPTKESARRPGTDT